MCVAGVCETEAESAEEVMELLQRGNQRRTTEPTAMNVTSSRSHAVLQVTVEQREANSQNVLIGKLSMIDLAGSERASETANRGIRLVEGANINRSLLALGNCINALASGCSFVPYRDSKLTRLLKDSLGGNCRTVMVANVSPNHNSYEDTLNTLKYANRAKNIRLSAQQNIMKPDNHVSQYEKAISDLRSEVALLKSKLAERGAPAPAVIGSIAEEPEGDESGLMEASERWKEEVVKNLESRTQLQRSLIEVDRGLKQWQVERETAKNIIQNWDESVGQGSPSSRVSTARRHLPKTLEEWQDHLAQIEESVRENMETRKSIEARLQQNKEAGKELQSQLRHRVLNQDIRTFLELIQRVQVLEVERLELDHVWEARREQLEGRDQEIAMLREQLRLRNEQLHAQQAMLSTEQQDNLPKRVSLLGCTLAENSPAPHRGALRIMHAWAPSAKEDEVLVLESQPNRERPAPLQQVVEENPTEDPLPPISGCSKAIDWRNVELPRASQIRGIARIQPPGSGPIMPVCQRPAGKGWREPPELRANAAVNIVHGSEESAGVHNVHCMAGKPNSAPSRESTCPPAIRRGPMEHRPTFDPGDETPGGFSRPMHRPGLHPQAIIDLDSQTPAPRLGREMISYKDNASPPNRRRPRARSEHGSRISRVGRIVVQPKVHDPWGPSR